MKNLSISVLITNYNTWDLTAKCVEKVYEFCENSIEKIVIVDDASPQKYEGEFPEKVMVINNKENKGYVASVNIGAQQIKEDIIVLLDSDAYPLMDICSSLENDFNKNPKLGALAFHLVDENNVPTGSGSSAPNFWQLLLGQKIYGKLPIKKKTTGAIVLYSCGVAIRREAFESINGFDESFDFLDGDIDFFMRLYQSGWQLKIVDNLFVFHKGGGSPQTTAKRVLRFYRNRYKLLQKHKLLPFPFILKILLFLRHTSEYLLLVIFGRFLIKNNIVLNDKKKSRMLLLKNVWRNYEVNELV